MRIGSFRHKGLERFWRDDDVRGLPAQQVEKLRAMLTAIEEAQELGEVLRYSGWRLHPLEGDRKGSWSMTVTRNYRLTFKMRGKAIEDVDLEDYH
jgi:proteic killer suppression protein